MTLNWPKNYFLKVVTRKFNATIQKPRVQKRKQTRVMVFGTFDLLHPGHIHFFKQARALASCPFLIVSVARDLNVERIKGRKPTKNEISRLNRVRQNPLVDKAVLGAKNEYFSHIRKQRPNVIALGYDQKAYVGELRRDLKRFGLKIRVVRLKPHRPKTYKTTFIRQSMLKYKR